MYVGSAEVATTYYDGLARPIQTRAGAGASDIVTQTRYNRVSKPDSLLGPSYLSPSHDYGTLSDATAGDRITLTSYDDDPLLRVSRVIPPGHSPSNAIKTSYGYWSHDGGLPHSFKTVTDEKGVATTSRIDPNGRVRYTIADAAGTDFSTRSNRTNYAQGRLVKV